jgi:hypothetical protein
MKWSVRAAAVLGGLVALGGLSLAPASAQVSGQPVTPCSPASPAVTDLGTKTIGSAFSATLCGPWLINQNVHAVANGVTFVNNKAVNANGAVVYQITISSLARIDWDDPTPAICGINRMDVTAAGLNGLPLTRSVQFTLICDATGNPFIPGGFFPNNLFPGAGTFGFPGSSVPFGLPGGFAPSVSNQEQQQQQQVTVAAPATTPAAAAAPAAVPAAATQGRVAFTGANVIRWSIAALTLMAVGALLVMHSRRRRPILGS